MCVCGVCERERERETVCVKPRIRIDRHHGAPHIHNTAPHNTHAHTTTTPKAHLKLHPPTHTHTPSLLPSRFWYWPTKKKQSCHDTQGVRGERHITDKATKRHKTRRRLKRGGAHSQRERDTHTPHTHTHTHTHMQRRAHTNMRLCVTACLYPVATITTCNCGIEYEE